MFEFIFFLILIGIISSSNEASKKKRRMSQRRTNYYALNEQQRQVVLRRQQEHMLRQMGGQVKNPYQNPYNPYLRTTTSQQRNPYTNAGRITNYGSPTMPPNTGYQQTNVNSFGLPSSERKRKKIVKKFSDRYGLNLSDQDIAQMVGASYMSTAWSREICYMNQKYETIYSWFATSNPWLKAYMYAFPLQQISSDFALQEQIVYNTFDQVFSDVLSKPDITVPEAIWQINSKYYTQFDESSFMIAYRFMEQKGKRYRLNLNDVVKGVSDIDDLLSKYEQYPTQMPSH